MRKRNLCFLSILSCLVSVPAVADWQYPGTYVGDGWYLDDGSRLVISGRGGAAIGMGTIKNQVGAISNEYYISPDGATIVSATYYFSCVDNGGCDGYQYAGYGDLNRLPPTKDLESFSFAMGFSMGFTMPNRPQWRLEGGWDHISESEYNSSPMFSGDLELIGGDVPGVVVEVQSSTVNSKLSTNVFSVMAFYDFFDGIQKPTNVMIPYVGFGIGYADTKTVLNLSDPYGDLSAQVELQQYGELDDYNIVQFYRSERDSSNVAGLLALGFSYGIGDNMFMDFGVRAMYLPSVKWELRNADKTKYREWFSTDDLIYINAMVGLRFEF